MAQLGLSWVGARRARNRADHILHCRPGARARCSNWPAAGLRCPANKRGLATVLALERQAGTGLSPDAGRDRHARDQRIAPKVGVPAHPRLRFRCAKRHRSITPCRETGCKRTMDYHRDQQ